MVHADATLQDVWSLGHASFIFNLFFSLFIFYTRSNDKLD